MCFPRESTFRNTSCPRRIWDFARQCRGDLSVARLVTDGKFPAAFGAAACEHFASILGGHAATKSVLVLSFSDAGLKRSFHNCKESKMNTPTEKASYEVRNDKCNCFNAVDAEEAVKTAERQARPSRRPRATPPFQAPCALQYPQPP